MSPELLSLNLKHRLWVWNGKCIFKKQLLLSLGVSGWRRQAIDAKLLMVYAFNTLCDHLLIFKVPHFEAVLSNVKNLREQWWRLWLKNWMKDNKRNIKIFCERKTLGRKFYLIPLTDKKVPEALICRNHVVLQQRRKI